MRNYAQNCANNRFNSPFYCETKLAASQPSYKFAQENYQGLTEISTYPILASSTYTPGQKSSTPMFF